MKFGCIYNELLSQVSLLSHVHWPANYDSIPSFGEQDVKALNNRFGIDAKRSVAGFKLSKAVGGKQLNDDL